ncbi:DUF3006 family protein [Natronomonas salsuginis]|jgi:hypothetical protein|uniref:DUF3006 family protein n=1 Tax=Natronomonas salsuginis TaxID=2217661 RepID=A0A4V6XUN1_9EURY|nr:DUF3006 family protein [Natronomonas salsuginis]TKR26063.1 DUF3006 family protein [Natronomonas salsuginis]
MRLDGEYAATVDRVVEGIAIFLIEGDEQPLDERHVPVGELSIDVSEGDRFRLEFDDGALVGIESRPEEAADRRKRFRERFERLSRRLDDEDADRR